MNKSRQTFKPEQFLEREPDPGRAIASEMRTSLKRRGHQLAPAELLEESRQIRRAERQQQETTVTTGSAALRRRTDQPTERESPTAEMRMILSDQDLETFNHTYNLNHYQESPTA